MVSERHVSLRPNGNGAQAYLNDKLLGDSRCPLDQGDKVLVKAVDYGLLFIPKDDDREFDVTPKEDSDGNH